MSISNGSIKLFSIILLLVQLCLPLSGPVFFYEYSSSDAEIVCAHSNADSDQKAQDGHEQIPHCHELDAPCVVDSCPRLKHSPVISSLYAYVKGSLLPGFGTPIEFPPENPV